MRARNMGVLGVGALVSVGAVLGIGCQFVAGITGDLKLDGTGGAGGSSTSSTASSSGMASSSSSGAGGTDGGVVGEWALGWEGNAELKDVVVDSKGDIVLVGHFVASLDIGMAPALSSKGASDIFVVKLHADGSISWVKQLGDMNNQVVSAVALDQADNIFIVGGNESTFSIGNVMLSQGAYVLKLDPSGAPLWAKSGSGASNVSGVAVDDQGNVVAVGAYSGTITFDANSKTSAGLYDIFIVEYASDGTFGWLKSFGKDKSEEAVKVAFDPSTQSFFVVGNYASDNLVLGGEILAPPALNGLTPFALVLSTSGTHLGSYTIGEGGMDAHAFDVAVSPGGAAYAVGDFTGTFTYNFGTQTLTSAGGYDAYVAALGAANASAPKWVKNFGDAAHQSATAVAADGDNNVAFTGKFKGTVNFGAQDLTSAPNVDATYIAGLDFTGAHRWSKALIGVEAVTPSAITVASSHEVILSGLFKGSLKVGMTSLLAPSGGVFIARIDTTPN